MTEHEQIVRWLIFFAGFIIGGICFIVGVFALILYSAHLDYKETNRTRSFQDYDRI